MLLWKYLKFSLLILTVLLGSLLFAKKSRQNFNSCVFTTNTVNNSDNKFYFQYNSDNWVLKSVTLGSTYQSIIKEVQNSYVGYIAFIGNGKKIKTLKNQLMNFGYTYAIGVFSNPSENLQTKSTLTIMKKTGDIKAGNVPNIVQKISGSFQCS